jgi:5'-3' exonuclease
MGYDKIFIDVSNFFHRAYHVSSDMTAKLDDGTLITTGGVFTSMRMVRKIERDFLNPFGEIFFVFDNTNSGDNKRKLIDPGYKSNRDKKDDSFYKALDLFHLMILNYKDNYTVVKRPGSEADDLISPLVSSYPDDTILLVSNDLDWFRSINETVHVAKYENGGYVIYDPERFLMKFGFEVSVPALVLYKAFRGDGSDNIPKGVPGIRETALIKIIENFNSVKEVLSSVDEIEYLTPVWKEKIKANAPRLYLNEKLVSFEPIPLKELEDFVFPCEFKPKMLNSLYKTLKFQVSSFDPRVAQLFPKRKQSSGNFFQFEPTPREK